MNTRMQFEMMEKALPYAAELMDCKEMKDFKASLKNREGVGNGELMQNLMPLFLSKKPDVVFGMLGALNGKTAEEIAEQAIGNTHGGILAICGDRLFPALTSPDQLTPEGFYVLLEGIEDPYNFGYALRSLYAAGVDAVFLSPRNWMSAAGVVARASAGASELLPMYIADSSESAAQIAREAKCKLVCADKENSVSMYDADLHRPLLLVIGGEKRGISRGLLSDADEIVRIDYARPFRAALSAASAATILGYEVMRQNLK